MVNSKQKGSRGEREAAKLLNKLLGCEARRGQQFKGTPESPDLVDAIPGVHVEVKRVEKLNLLNAINQAKADAGADEVAMVLHRRNQTPWLVTIEADNIVAFAERVLSVRRNPSQ